MIRKAFLFLFLFAAAASSYADKIVSANLCFDVKNSKTDGKEIFINGKKIGNLPLSRNGDFQRVSLSVPEDALAAIATVNNVRISNSPKDLFSVNDLSLEVTTDAGATISSDIRRGVFHGFATGFVMKNGKPDYTYSGTSSVEVRLTLPSGALGYLRQASPGNAKADIAMPCPPRQWQGLDLIKENDPGRTICNIRIHEFIAWPEEYLLAMLKRHNSDTIMFDYREKMIANQKDKINFLRKNNIKINLLYPPSLMDPCDRLPASEEYKKFFNELNEWAPLIDIAGLDEWFLSPAVLKTEGGHCSKITERFLDAFSRYSGYSSEDSRWAFENWRSDDKRALKAWEFCFKVQNDFAREFVRVAKKANPGIKTWISYVGRNWNKNVACIDDAVAEFDQILDCQTYWYGRFAEDPMNSPLLTAPVGRGKIFRAEYPGKFLWMGFDPGYAGGKEDSGREKSWQRKHYANMPEETVPYLALLYAVSNGVFIESSGGGVWLLGDNWAKRQLDGRYFDDSADVINLVSRLVPCIKDYKKSDIAYYYEPDADWEIVRRVNNLMVFRETNDCAIGLLEQYCDVDVVSDPEHYSNVVYAGMLLPSKFDYAKQNIYLMFAPEYDECANKISADLLSEKLGVKAFGDMGKTFFPSDGANENGAKDQFLIQGLPGDTLLYGRSIQGSAYPYRTTAYAKSRDLVVIGARNKNGNVVLNSLWPSFILQDVAERTVKKDVDYMGWTRRDCPQVNGVDQVVAVAFREPRAAVLDFGPDSRADKINIIVFNGKNGIVRNETINYRRGMNIDIPPFNVLVGKLVK